MLIAKYATKKLLKASKGQKLKFSEASTVFHEYRADEAFWVAGPSKHNRQWSAKVTMENGKIKSVR